MPRTGKTIERAGTLDPYSGYTSAKDDPEFESRAKSIIGKPFESVIDRSVAQNIGTPNSQYNYLGLNTHKAETPEQKKKVAKLLGLAALPEGKHVFGVGSGAGPHTWAHEFRHDKVDDETYNRVADLIYGSTSRDAYVANVDSLWEHLNGLDNETPFAERERKALNLANNFLYARPEYRTDNIQPSIDYHFNINRKGPSSFTETVRHPIESIMGDKVDTEMGRIAKSTAKERAAYPFLLFAGREDLPRSQSYEGASLGEKIEKTKSKKRGGAIENTTHSRKMI